MDFLRTGSGTETPFRPQSAQDWEPYKNIITNLYRTMELTGLHGVMWTMENEYDFKATENQYKKQFAKWSVDKKRIKAVEYGAIVRKKRQRELDGKDSDISLRGEKVSSRNIQRFEKRRKITDQDPLYNAVTPPGLVLLTPPPHVDENMYPLPPADPATRSRKTSDVHHEFDLLETKLLDERLSLTSIPALLRASTTPALTEIRPQDWTHFSSIRRCYAKQKSKPSSVTDPMVASLRLAAYRSPNYGDEVGFQDAFSSLKVEHDCFGCKVVAFMEHLTKQFMTNSIDSEDFQASVGCLIRYAIKAGRGRSGFLPGMSLNLGRYYAALDQSHKCEGLSLPISQKQDDEEISVAQHHPKVTVGHYHMRRRVKYDALLLKDLLGQAYDGALWTWRRSNTPESLCCRCRQTLITLQTGFQENVHKCPKFLGEPTVEDSERFLGQRYEFSEFRELIRQRWAIFCAFLFLGWSKKGTTVDIDDEIIDENCLQLFNTWKIPCTESSSECRAKCHWKSLEQWII